MMNSAAINPLLLVIFNIWCFFPQSNPSSGSLFSIRPYFIQRVWNNKYKKIPSSIEAIVFMSLSLSLGLFLFRINCCWYMMFTLPLNNHTVPAICPMQRHRNYTVHHFCLWLLKDLSERSKCWPCESGVNTSLVLCIFAWVLIPR